MFSLALRVLFISALVLQVVLAHNGTANLSEILTKLQQQEKLIKQLQEEDVNLKSTISRLEKELSTCSGKLTDEVKTEGRNGTISSEMMEDALPYQECAFAVHTDKDIRLNNGAVLVFDSAYLNENNCYNTGDGIFEASLNGIYSFTWKVTAHSGKSGGVRFYVNGQKRAPDLLSRTSSGGHNSVTSFAVVRLERGDHVLLKSDMDNSFIHGLHSGFGGYFVRE